MGRQEAQGTVGTATVIVVEMFLERPVDVGHPQLPVVEGPELRACGLVSPLDTTVVLGATRGQDMKGKVQVLTGGLELGHEFRSAVDLEGGDGKGHLLEDGLEETGGVASGGARVAAHDHLLGDGADGLELLEADSGQGGDIHGVDLDQLAGLGGFHPVTPALGVTFLEIATPFRLEFPLVEGTGTDATQAHPLGQDAADGGDAAGKSMVSLQEEVQAELAAEGVAAPHLPDEVFVVVSPLWGPDVAGATRAGDEAGQAGGVEPFLPTVIGGSGPADGLQGEGWGTALATEPLIEAEFPVALEGFLGGGIVHRHLPVEWARQSFDLQGSGPPS